MRHVFELVVVRSSSVRVSRRLTLVILPGTALAAPRDTVEYQLVFHGSVDCGTFMDNYEDRYDIRETDEFDADGNLTRVLYHAEHTSDDVNSVTGFTLHEHGHFYEVDDFVKGTFTVTGSQEVANRNGHGVVIQDTGRIVYDEDFTPIFFAGGRKHSQELLGEEIWCDALG